MDRYYFNTKKLCVGYDKNVLIKDIEFQIEKGEIVCLIGPNGSGKSTILKSITKHLKKISGTVYIEKEDMERISHSRLSKKLAVVLTERIKTELMTCWDVVATGRYPYTGYMGVLSPTDKKIVDDSMKMVEAYNLKDRSFEAISDGQRQRILLARAICQEPDIIILDEPTSFLDVKHKLELLSILKTMAKKNNISVIMSLHEIDLAQKISDKIMCVKGEYIGAYGPPSQIFTQQLIEELYEIKSGSYNTIFGSVELSSNKSIPKIFLVAGDGKGIAYYRELQRLEIPFAVGVLHENDIDTQIAKALASRIIIERSFSQISDERYKEALDCLKSCEYLLYTGVEFGEINSKNQLLIEAARVMKIPIIENLSELENNIDRTIDINYATS